MIQPAHEPLPIPLQEPLSRDQINELPLFEFEGTIALASDRAEAREWVERLRQEHLVGFDTESRPAFRKGQSFPPALVQCATSEAVVIFRLAIPEVVEELVGLLRDSAVKKAGIALHDDVRKLQQLRRFEAHGFEDLAVYATRAGVPGVGLRGLAARFLGRRVSKSAQRSNWGRRDLTDRQLRYAATDAWVCRELYLKMRSLNLLGR